MKKNLCPCGSALPFADCCGPIHLNPKLANHPEKLMRARYSAHAKNNICFIEQSWHPSTRPSDMKEIEAWNKTCTWLALNVANSRRLGKKGVVEFVGLYRQSGKLQQHHEIAHFVLEKGQWWYLERD